MEKIIEKKPLCVPTWAAGGDIFRPTDEEIYQGWPKTDTPPSRQRFNWILNYVCGIGHYLMQYGVPQWDKDQIYPKGAKVMARDGQTYMATDVCENKDPLSGGGSWVRWGYTRDDIIDVVKSLSIGGAPTGSISYFPSSKAPEGWLLCAGQMLSRAQYPQLWAYASASGNIYAEQMWESEKMLGSFSYGDNSTTFRLPDLRNMFVRGFDDRPSEVEEGGKRPLGSFQAYSTESLSTFNLEGNGLDWYTNSIPLSTISEKETGNRVLMSKVTNGREPIKLDVQHESTKLDPKRQRETRPSNVSLLPCIKT